MSRISTSYPNLINGVSQQPDTLRFPSQCEEQENFLSSVTDGLIKRPPTEHVAKIYDSYGGNALVHTINRDEDNRFVVVVTDGAVKVFDIDGTEQTVNLKEGAADYLETSDPKNDIRALTVADYTFLLNRTKTVEMTEDKTYDPRHTAFITIVQGDYEKKYTIAVGNAITSGTPASKEFSFGGAGNDFKIEAKISGPQFNDVRITTQFDRYAATNSVTVFYSSTGKLISLWYKGIITPDKLAAAFTASNTAKDFWQVVDTGGEDGSGSLDMTQVVGTTSGGVATFAGLQTFEHPTSTSAAGIQTDAIATELYNKLTHVSTGLNALAVEGHSSWSVTRSGSTIRIKRGDNADFPIRITDSLNDTAMTLVKGEVSSITALPTVCEHRFVTKVAGLVDENGDDFWVQFRGENEGQGQYATFDKGVWIESVEPNSIYKLNAETMPYSLIQNEDGTWDVQTASWADRIVGDEETNSNPSFVNQTISDLFFVRNRLGLLSGENAILSENGNPFNFFRTSILSLLDADPIDVTAAHTKVSVLNSAIPFSERLLLFSEQTQFVLGGGEILTPKTVSITQATEFTNLSRVRPVVAGEKVFFAFPRGSFSGVMEYRLSPDSAASTTQFAGIEVTGHIPKYIEGEITRMSVAVNENILAVQSSGLTNGLYLYKWFEADGQKLQSAWFKWTFAGASLKSAEFINSTLYVVLDREGDLYLERINVQPGLTDLHADYTVHLDRRITDETEGVTSSYDSLNNRTTFTLPFDIPEEVSVQVVTRFTDPQVGMAGGILLQKHSQGADTVVVTGDRTEQPVWIGENYTASYTMSNPVLKTTTDTGGKAILATGRFQLLRGYLVYNASKYFKVNVTPKYRDTYTYKFTSRVLGTGTAVVGQDNLEEGIFPFAVRSKNDQVLITLVNDSPFPSGLLSVDWEANFNTRSQRFAG